MSPHRRRRTSFDLPKRIERADERIARRINARRTIRGADAFWRDLSTAANHGVLWFAAAGVLMALGKPRAAARGLASLGIASALANLIGKQLVGGERPALTSIPISRRLDRTPTSPSFPSGHTASAVAFATGAALESPQTGAALAPLAAAVGYSRLHTGAHWASDVAGGAIIGMTAALIGKAIVPSKPVPLARLREAPTAATLDLPSLPDGEGAFIVVNPNSGHDAGRPSPIPRLRHRLPRAVVHELKKGDDIAELVDAALASPTPPRVLGIYGGDGSVAAMAGTARRVDLPLMVMPGGTFNHFAKAALLESVDSAIDALIAGSGRPVDVAELTVADGEPITVLNTASVGIYPAFVAEREKHERRLGKPLAAALAAVRILRMADPIDVELDGRRQKVWSIFVGVDRYYPVTVAPIERRRLDDRLLDIRILRADRRPRTRGALALALGGRGDTIAARMPFLQGPPAVDASTDVELRVVTYDNASGDPGYAHDGEASKETPRAADGSHPLSIRVVPAGLRLYAPVKKENHG
ncbi:bifunctional phosphatase PAP2/diacylglycerol kinase family protein [Leifsonia poae]|uniref:Phosphoesterase n=1 Tax=Leifsonia poae TaxID=110933 RepID=A0A9W6H917_9MICO|nr:bifunctional phosphatase PAP2/diacylglycerol kinase family protein [Leifsonia poae]GLJ75738.1 phosphoesterase [Leifsonia poae]